jgi:HMG (high mobility group) box
MIREEVRGRNLSFTDIAKLVGDRWQKLCPDDREPFEAQANATKERFSTELAQYKKTDFYCQYTQYIADFKAKHSGNAPDGKRPKLEEDFRVVNAPSRTKELMVETRDKVSATHGRDFSIGSGSSASYLGSITSPKGGSGTLPPPMMGSGVSPNLSRISPCPTANSPPSRPEHREKRFPPLVSRHASATTDPPQMRGDVPDLHSRTGQLSLSPLTNSVILSMGDPRPSTRAPATFLFPALQHHSSSLSSGAHSDSSGTPNAPPMTPADEPWRYPAGEGKGLGPEWPQIYNPLPAINSGTPFGQLPPLQKPCDRTLDESRDPNQHTFPFPAHSYPRDLKASPRGHGRNPPPMLPSSSRTGSPSGSRDEGKSILENSENDAANTLAVLACLGR